MPLYVYKCSQCGGTVEKLQKFSDAALEDCPICKGQHTLSKQISTGTGFLLKGHGWYRPGLSTSSSGHES